MKKTLVFSLMLALPLFYMACGDSGDNNAGSESSSTASEQTETPKEDETPYDPTRGEGKYDEENFVVSGMDNALADKGQSISETKCFSCHKASDEMLVGPGWKDVTKRRTPHWLMNFITNPDPMIDKDPAVQEQLEQCLVRMPNQNLQEDEARGIVEYMRRNDGAK